MINIMITELSQPHLTFLTWRTTTQYHLQDSKRSWFSARWCHRGDQGSRSFFFLTTRGSGSNACIQIQTCKWPCNALHFPECFWLFQLRNNQPYHVKVVDNLRPKEIGRRTSVSLQLSLLHQHCLRLIIPSLWRHSSHHFNAGFRGSMQVLSCSCIFTLSVWSETASNTFFFVCVCPSIILQTAYWDLKASFSQDSGWCQQGLHQVHDCTSWRSFQ